MASAQLSCVGCKVLLPALLVVAEIMAARSCFGDASHALMQGQVLIKGRARKGLLADDKELASQLKVGMVFQNGALFDSLNVQENVGFMLYEHSNLPDDRIQVLNTPSEHAPQRLNPFSVDLGQTSPTAVLTQQPAVPLMACTLSFSPIRCCLNSFHVFVQQRSGVHNHCRRSALCHFAISPLHCHVE